MSNTIVPIADELYQNISSFIYSTESYLDSMKESGQLPTFLRLIKDVERYAEKRKKYQQSTSFEEIVKSLESL